MSTGKQFSSKARCPRKWSSTKPRDARGAMKSGVPSGSCGRVPVEQPQSALTLAYAAVARCNMPDLRCKSPRSSVHWKTRCGTSGECGRRRCSDPLKARFGAIGIVRASRRGSLQRRVLFWSDSMNASRPSWRTWRPVRCFRHHYRSFSCRSDDWSRDYHVLIAFRRSRSRSVRM